MKKSRNLIVSILVVFSFSLIVTGCISNQSTSSEHANHSRMGSHGMAVIGTTNLLFHHMPLYRPPHDRQILIPAKFVDDKTKIAFEKWRQSYSGLVSIVPENFDLNRLEPGSTNAITSFVADIYQGHFERGGQVVFESIEFKLYKPIFHRPVTGDPTSEQVYTYLEHGSEAYLIRDIGPRPGVDQILGVDLDTNLQSGERLTLLSDSPDGRLKVMRNDQSILGINVRARLYLEKSDFQALK